MFRFSAVEQNLITANKWLERMMPLLTPTGVILGLVAARFFIDGKPFVTPLFAFLTLVSGMGVTVKDFGAIIRKPKPIFIFLLTTYIITPCIMTGLANLLFHGKGDVITGFVLLYAIPTAVVGCIWSSIYNGNNALSLTLIVIGTMLAPISVPLTVRVLASSHIEFDTSGMMLSLIYMVVIPSAVGILINALTKGHCMDHAVPVLKPFTKIGLLFVVIINTSQIADDLIASASVAYIPQALAAFCFTVLGFIISRTIARLARLDHANTVSVTFASSMKNISAAMVLAIQFFPPASLIPIISGIVLQQTTTAISAHFLFGNKPDKNIMENTQGKGDVI